MAHGDITHIDIPVSNMAAATGFYGTLFGWQISEPPGFEGHPMWSTPYGVGSGGLSPRSEDFADPVGNAIGLYEGVTEMTEG
ncbi:VOC family protein [Demequina sp. SO4-18]|uniref:VOC family protein n=1 Tax=Demequina sp. SO4-18 TaxID=3401026 RepID=UPI003B5AA811